MNKAMHLVAPGYRPLLLTTRVLYPRWRELLWNVRLHERKGLIVVLPKESPKTRECLLAIAREYESRGGSVRMIEEGSGVARYYEMRQHLSTGRR